MLAHKRPQDALFREGGMVARTKSIHIVADKVLVCLMLGFASL